jgi:hypothetical protein
LELYELDSQVEFSSIVCERDGDGACVHAMLRAPMATGILHAELLIETSNSEPSAMGREELEGWAERAILAALCGGSIRSGT